MLGYASTRFIGFKGCIERIIENFDGLKTFFDTEKKAPVDLCRFFDHPLSKLLLIFVRDQCEYFELAVRSLEGSHVSAYEAAKTVFALSSSIREKISERFTSLEFNREQSLISERLPFNDTVLVKDGTKTKNIEVYVDEQYVDDMVHRFQGKFCLIVKIL